MPTLPTLSSSFAVTHIDEDLTNTPLSYHENELFFNCQLKNLRGVTLKNCKMQHSSVKSDTLEELLGLTVTLDCGTFANVEISELMFDLMLMLLIKTKGNTAKRRKLIDLLGESRVRELLTALKRTE